MLSQDQVGFFEENGFLHLRAVISARELEILREAADRLAQDAQERVRDDGFRRELHQARPDWIEHPGTHYVYAEDDGELNFHRVERMWTKDAIFRLTTMHPDVLEAVGCLLAGQPFWPRGGSLVYKMPHHGAAVPWHQDIPYYWRRSLMDVPRPRAQTFPQPNFTTDFYLDESRSHRGGLWCIPGTHRQGSVDVDALVAQHGFELPGAVPLDAEPGDVMFHHVALVHGSDTNTSSVVRRTFYQHYMAEAVLRDAYSDWPDLKNDRENEETWRAAIEGRRAEGLKTGGDARIGPAGISIRT